MDAPHAPHDAHISIGVPPVQLPLVVEVDAKLYGLFWAGRPLQDLQVMPDRLSDHRDGQARDDARQHSVGVVICCYAELTPALICKQSQDAFRSCSCAQAHLLGPVHAHEAVHLSCVHHLQLRCVPQLVERLPLLQLLTADKLHWMICIPALNS